MSTQHTYPLRLTKRLITILISNTFTIQNYRGSVPEYPTTGKKGGGKGGNPFAGGF